MRNCDTMIISFSNIRYLPAISTRVDNGIKEAWFRYKNWMISGWNLYERIEILIFIYMLHTLVVNIILGICISEYVKIFWCYKGFSNERFHFIMKITGCLRENEWMFTPLWRESYANRGKWYLPKVQHGYTFKTIFFSWKFPWPIHTFMAVCPR